MIRSNETLPMADRIVIHKAARRLDLMRGYSVLRSYHVALGLNPIGQKQRSGDFRTPEGTYYLARPHGAQRLLPFHPGLVSEHCGILAAGAPQSLAYRPASIMYSLACPTP